MSAIENYQNKNEMVCMVGDGINDAPALKKAYVGSIAIIINSALLLNFKSN